MGLVAPQHVGSSRTRVQTRVPCIGRWILTHFAPREAPLGFSLFEVFDYFLNFSSYNSVQIFYFFFLFLLNFIFLYSRFLLVIHFIHISVYMSIPISHFITPPPPPLPLSSLGVHTFVLYICVSISVLQTIFLYHFSRFHIYVLIYNIFLFLTYFTLYDSL